MYYIFKRSCRNWKEFASARKFFIQGGLTYERARQLCEEWNKNLTPAQIRKGTKFEFQGEEHRR